MSKVELGKWNCGVFTNFELALMLSASIYSRHSKIKQGKYGYNFAENFTIAHGLLIKKVEPEHWPNISLKHTDGIDFLFLQNL